MEERPYPPSELKLARLRKAGIVPVSRDLSSFSVLLGALVGIWLLLSYATQAVPLSMQSIDAEVSGAVLWRALSIVVIGSAFFLVPLLVVVALVGGFQTRFLFNLSLVQFSLGRVFTWWENLSGGWSRRVFLASLGVCKVIGWSWVVYTVGTASLPDIAAAPESLTAQYSQGWRVVRIIGLAALGYLFFFGVLSRFLVVLVFRANQRMSRGELEAEYRETELSSDVKAARKSFWDGD